MKTPVKVTIVTAALVVGLLLAALIYVLINNASSSSPSTGGDQPQVIRPNSHVLDEGREGAVTVVEFLDFECEACGAFYPIVEDLRTQFAGEITYVVRYFPLPGHINSTNAALAAEAAAQQGHFEAMYHRLFDTQASWGEAQDSRADIFRGFAEELGLDMAAYDEAVVSPETMARVKLDFDEGQALGVSSTPTFFVDGEPVQLELLTDLEDAIAQAVSGAQ